jgi:hypothetical protein
MVSTCGNGYALASKLVASLAALSEMTYVVERILFATLEFR